MQKLAAITVGVLAFVPCLVFADGSQSYTSPGTYTFNVPSYNSLTVTVDGAGGGGSGGNFDNEIPSPSVFAGSSGSGGGYSAFDGNIVGYGGGGATVSSSGGDSPGGSVTISQQNGSAGSASGGNVSNSSGAGDAGGGGGGGYNGTNGSTGGSGGQAVVSYGQGLAGQNITVIVGSGGGGGAGGYDPYTTDGSSGQSGAVYVSWTSPVSAPSVSLLANGQQNLNTSLATNYTLSWSSSNASSCTLSWQGAGSYQGVNGSEGITPDQSSSGASGLIGTYTLSCSGPGGQGSASATITSNPPACNVSLSPNPSAYSYSGTPVTLSWTSTYSSQVYINNIGWVGASGSTNIASQASTDYSCYGYSSSYGSGSWHSASLTVSAAPSPSISINASPASVPVGQPTTITAHFTPGSGDAITDDTINIGSTSVIPYSTATTRTYTFTPSSAGTTTFLPYIMTGYYNSWNTWGNSVSVTAYAPPTVSLSVSPSSVAEGGSATLSWSSTNATSCTGVNFSTGSATSGSVNVSPLQGTTYSGSCTGPGGTTNFTPVVLSVSCTPAVAYSCSSGSPQNVVQTATSSACAVTVTNPYNSQVCTSPAYCSTGVSSCEYPFISENVSGNLSGNLQTIPSIVSSGDTVQVYWNISNAQSCTAKSTNGDSWTGLTSGNSGKTSKAITAPTTFTLSCPAYGGNPNLNETQTVQVTPTFEEQ